MNPADVAQSVIDLWARGVIQHMLPFYGLISLCLVAIYLFPGRDS